MKGQSNVFALDAVSKAYANETHGGEEEGTHISLHFA